MMCTFAMLNLYNKCSKTTNLLGYGVISASLCDSKLAFEINLHCFNQLAFVIQQPTSR